MSTNKTPSRHSSKPLRTSRSKCTFCGCTSAAHHPVYRGNRQPKKIRDEYLAARHKMEVDIYQQPRPAIEEHVSAVPMLVKRLPILVRRLIGNLSNVGFVQQRLALRGT